MRTLLLVAVMLVVSSLAGASQPGDSPSPVVAVAAWGSPENSRLSAVLRDAVDLELRSEEFLTAAPPVDLPQSSRSAGSISEHLPRGTSFLTIVSYVDNATGLLVSIAFVDVTSQTTIARAEATLLLDLDLDTGVGELVRSLISQSPVKDAVAAAIRAGRLPAAQPGGAPSPSGATPAQPAPLPAIQPASPTGSRTPARWRFNAMVSGAPLFILGDAASYFRYGASGASFLGLVAPISRLFLSIGLRLEVTELFPTAGPGQGRVYVVPAGVEVVVGSNPAAALSVCARAVGGAATLVLTPKSGGVVAKTDAFVGAGLGAYAKLWRIEVGIEMGTTVIFEPVRPIAALKPTLVVRM